MTENNSIDQAVESGARRSFMSELAYRRVPQVFGLYLAGSWTFMEFFDSIIGRHNLSPHWADISLVILGLMLPTVIILAYRHGAPGAQSWSKFEKVGIPANILAVFAVLFINYADKDLGSRAEMVEGMSPDGSVMTIVRPKEEYRKRLLIGFFKLNSNTVDESMRFGISHALTTDLDQNPYTNTFDALFSPRPLIESDFTDFYAPLPLMLKIARDNRMEYYISGDLREVTSGNFVISIDIYDVNEGNKLTELKTIAKSDIFSAIDELTPRIKEAIELPEFIIKDSPDLPIEEQLTTNTDAYKNYINSIRQYVLLSDFAEGEKLLNEAIALDSTFAVALADLSSTLLNQTRISEGLDVLKKAEKHNYRLNVNRKFQLATFGNIFKGQHEQAVRTLERWLELYPDSIQAWSSKANIHRILNQREEAIAAIDKLLELEPYAINRYISKGQLYLSMGQVEKAIEAFNIFAERNPSHARIKILLGDSYRLQGNFELADRQYQQAQILEVNTLEADRKLLENLKRQGKFKEAELGYLALLDEANSTLTKFEIATALRNLYTETGRTDLALEWYDTSYDFLSQVAPESNVLMRKMFDSWNYAQMGKPELGQELLDQGHAALERYDNELYKVNLLIGQAMFDVFKGESDNPFTTIDAVQTDVQKFVGDGNNHTFNMMRGIAYHLTGQHDKAVELLSEYTKTHPNQQRGIWLSLADSLRDTDQLEDSLEVYQRILLEYPAHPETHFQLAQLHIKSGDLVAAESALNVAINGWKEAEEQYEYKLRAIALKNEIAGKTS